MSLCKILAVDDDPTNLEILQLQLQSETYEVVLSSDGAAALEILQSDPASFGCVLLDRRMPEGMDGMEVLQQIRENRSLDHVSVIFQSAKVMLKDISDGLAAGARYYLKKPFGKDELLAAVRSAVFEFEKYQSLYTRIKNEESYWSMWQSGTLHLRTLDEGWFIAYRLGNLHSASMVTVLTEIIRNAVEHGNLGITYHEKSKFLADDTLDQEIERRLLLPEHCDKYVSVRMEKTTEGGFVFTVQDQGDGFDWRRYLTIDPLRLTDPHGKGVALANLISGGRLSFIGKGNEVVIHAPCP
ncbi:MAG: response regulator [Magnetococcus sp. THC-1_WYH]